MPCLLTTRCLCWGSANRSKYPFFCQSFVSAAVTCGQCVLHGTVSGHKGWSRTFHDRTLAVFMLDSQLLHAGWEFHRCWTAIWQDKSWNYVLSVMDNWGSFLSISQPCVFLWRKKMPFILHPCTCHGSFALFLDRATPECLVRACCGLCQQWPLHWPCKQHHLHQLRIGNHQLQGIVHPQVV